MDRDGWVGLASHITIPNHTEINFNNPNLNSPVIMFVSIYYLCILA